MQGVLANPDVKEGDERASFSFGEQAPPHPLHLQPVLFVALTVLCVALTVLCVALTVLCMALTVLCVALTVLCMALTVLYGS